MWRNTTNTPTGAYDTYAYDAYAYDAYAYDATAGGNVGIGRLTAETFSAGSLSGGYAYTDAGRRQQTASTLTVGAASYPLATTYDDAGNVLTQAYPNGESITNSYTRQPALRRVAVRDRLAVRVGLRQHVAG